MDIWKLHQSQEQRNNSSLRILRAAKATHQNCSPKASKVEEKYRVYHSKQGKSSRPQKYFNFVFTVSGIQNQPFLTDEERFGSDQMAFYKPHYLRCLWPSFELVGLNCTQNSSIIIVGCFKCIGNFASWLTLWYMCVCVCGGSHQLSPVHGNTINYLRSQAWCVVGT